MRRIIFIFITIIFLSNNVFGQSYTVNDFVGTWRYTSNDTVFTVVLIKGEDLNLLIGSIPYNDKDISEKVKLNILALLNEKYDITEKDLLSSELEIVPAFKARSLGFDGSMVASHNVIEKAIKKFFKLSI